jgi:hypothetical protein
MRKAIIANGLAIRYLACGWVATQTVRLSNYDSLPPIGWADLASPCERHVTDYGFVQRTIRGKLRRIRQSADELWKWFWFRLRLGEVSFVSVIFGSLLLNEARKFDPTRHPTTFLLILLKVCSDLSV